MQAHEIIRKTRLALGINQTEAAQRCGVSFSAYEKWERGAVMKAPMVAGVLLMLGTDAATALKAARSLL